MTKEERDRVAALGVVVACYGYDSKGIMKRAKERKVKAMSDIFGHEYTVSKKPVLVEEEDMGIMGVKVKDPVPTAVAIPGGYLQKHVDLISRKREIIQTEMIKLTQELMTIASYQNNSTAYIENCKIAVNFTLQVSFADCSFYIREYSKDEHETTWKDLVNEILLEPAMKNIIESTKRVTGKRGHKNSFVKFGDIRMCTVPWRVNSNQFPISAIKLLSAYRLLAQEKLEELYRETSIDLEYLKGMVLSGEDGT